MVDRETDKVERVPYFMRDALCQLGDTGEVFSFPKFFLEGAFFPEFLYQLIEGMGQFPDLVFSVRMEFRGKIPRCHIPCCIYDIMNWLCIHQGQEYGEDNAESEDQRGRDDSFNSVACKNF